MEYDLFQHGLDLPRQRAARIGSLGCAQPLHCQRLNLIEQAGDGRNTLLRRVDFTLDLIEIRLGLLVLRDIHVKLQDRAHLVGCVGRLERPSVLKKPATAPGKGQTSCDRAR